MVSGELDPSRFAWRANAAGYIGFPFDVIGRSLLAAAAVAADGDATSPCGVSLRASAARLAMHLLRVCTSAWGPPFFLHCGYVSTSAV